MGWRVWQMTKLFGKRLYLPLVQSSANNLPTMPKNTIFACPTF